VITLIRHDITGKMSKTVTGKYWIVLFCILVSGFFFTASAQKSFDVTAGIGYYELTHAGILWNYSAKSSVGLYGGFNVLNRSEKKLNSIGLSFTHIYLKPLFWKIQPGFSFKTQYWNQEDDNYFIDNVSFLFQGVLSYPVNNRLRLGIEGGGVLNFAMETERKQNTTVGYPTRWNGNGTFFISYRLNKKSQTL
jgi:hypothetical protein